MCEPTTMAVVAGTGAALNVYGQYKQGQASASAARANARSLNRQAKDVIRRGAQEARSAEISGRFEQDAAVAQAAAGGVDSTRGSTAKAIEAGGVGTALDVATIRANAAREAFGLDDQARELRRQGKAAKKGGILGAIGGTLTGAASVGTTYKAFK